jgi:hypothetical protein
MNNQVKYHEDPIRKYIKPGNREEAPEGFTSKVMTRIGLDTLPSAETSRKRSLVPYISVLIIILLIAAAYLIPYNNTDLFTQGILNFIKGIDSSVSRINLTSIFSLTMPAVITYALVGILVLTVFDRALYRFFKKEK